MRNISLFFLFIAFVLSACKKSKPQAPPEVSKVINAFLFQTRENPSLPENVHGIIRNDSIIVKLKEGTSLNALTPTITHTGTKVEPASGVPQDFTSTVIYTVTAEDGSQTKYKVVVSYSSSEKEIIAFDIKSADNPGLTGDVTGQIQGDTISILIPPSVSFDNLRPAIKYLGKSISPSSGESKNFSLPVKYTVTAEDKTTKDYIVLVNQDSVVYFGCTDGKLYALNAVNGNIKWTFQAGSLIGSNGAITSSVVLYKGNIYFGSDDHSVYAVNAKTGTLTWKYRADYSVWSSPTLKNDVLYITCANNTTQIGYTFALDALSGNLKWRSQDIYYGPYSPTVGTDAVYTNSWGRGLYAFDINTGATKWLHEMDYTFERFALHNGVIYGGAEISRIFALNAATGDFIWKSPQRKAALYTIPIFVDEKVIFFADHIVCLNAATGDTIWISKNGLNLALGTPFYDNGVMYSAAATGQIVALNATNGEEKWRFSDHTAAAAGLGLPNITVSSNTVYAPANINYFCALDKATGKARWKFKAGAPVIGGACVISANNQVFHAGNSGNKE